NKYIPNSVKMALVPTCTILVMLPLMLCVLAPIGSFCGVAIAAAASWLADTIGPLAVGLIGGLWYFLVGLGMDKALVPVVTNQFATYGYDNLFWLSAIMATYSLMGVGLSYIIRGRKEDRSVAVSNAITLMLGGISEPTIFTTIWRYKKAMAYLFAGGFIGGAIASFLNVKAYTIGTGNVLFFTVCAGGDGKSLVPGIICGVISFAVSFILGLVFGFEDKKKVKESE
ncbi:MAG: PTS transporter subunit EIIC, partial [Clostridiales bacterium]|nr:PTS transporter subunit EIIC [Clostridiales bacterium]